MLLCFAGLVGLSLVPLLTLNVMADEVFMRDLTLRIRDSSITNSSQPVASEVEASDENVSANNSSETPTYSCEGGGLGNICNNTIFGALNDGRLDSITSEHQFYTGSRLECKLTYWTSFTYPNLYFIEYHKNTKRESTSTVNLNSDELFAAIKAIDEYCIASGLSLAELNERGKTRGWRGRYTGMIGSNNVTIQLDGYQGGHHRRPFRHSIISKPDFDILPPGENELH
ncbi:hypothetical protein CROQUDRAFT_86458 [Cronartium quercuum f. sp. fusiforme G11]|uniref:Uncharacterized protein n=1 Tax=Cronartium quercuum f. sp. fusiforme G11 TaxID=708437 RepID=A0A9P6NT83_9BASI|nr:hypothetical protein CROQUDRAFT_86458 [Cronartium quercuum f. sp. fusiforme G11]